MNQEVELKVFYQAEAILLRVGIISPKFKRCNLGKQGLSMVTRNQSRISVVLVSQGSGHTSHHLLIGSLHLWGEFLAKVAGQHTQQDVAQELWRRDNGHGQQLGPAWTQNTPASSQAVHLELQQLPWSSGKRVDKNIHTINREIKLGF